MFRDYFHQVSDSVVDYIRQNYENPLDIEDIDDLREELKLDENVLGYRWRSSMSDDQLMDAVGELILDEYFIDALEDMSYNASDLIANGAPFIDKVARSLIVDILHLPSLIDRAYENTR